MLRGRTSVELDVLPVREIDVLFIACRMSNKWSSLEIERMPFDLVAPDGAA
jgi:hypothetical protein